MSLISIEFFRYVLPTFNVSNAMLVNNTGSLVTNGPISLTQLPTTPGNAIFLGISVVFDINDENASAFQSNGIYAATTREFSNLSKISLY